MIDASRVHAPLEIGNRLRNAHVEMGVSIDHCR
jgi:hypothetical protein